MATRATTHLSVEPDQVVKRLPPRYRACVDVALLGRKPVDLLVFQTGENHVVDSTDLRKALEDRAGSPERIVAVGYDFTEEARTLVDAAGGISFSQRSFVLGWTDERWHAIRQR
jgi:hypothetical protein